MSFDQIISGGYAFALVLAPSVLLQVLLGVPLAQHGAARGKLSAPLMLVAVVLSLAFAALSVVGLANFGNADWPTRLALTCFVCGVPGAAIFAGIAIAPRALIGDDELDRIAMRDLTE